jgi:hypothetical protein
MKHIIALCIIMLFIGAFSNAQNTTNDEIYFKVKDSIFAKTADIVLYDTTNHTINFSQEKRLALELLKIPVGGFSYAIFVNREKIFEGKIFSIESSVSCDCIALVRTIPDSALPPLQIELGYPSAKFYTGTDKRNDKKLIEVLSARNIKMQ